MESGYSPFHPNNPTSTGERPVAFKPGFVNNPDLATTNSFRAQGGFGNEMLATTSNFGPSGYNLPQWNFMPNTNDINLAGLDHNYLNSVNNIHMMDPNYFYSQNPAMTMAMPFSMAMGTGGMMPTQMMMGVSNYSGHNFGQFGSLPTTNPGLQPQTLAQTSKLAANQPLQTSFQPNMNGIYIPSNTSSAHMGEMSSRFNPSIPRNGAAHQQADLNNQQNMNYYSMANYSQTFSNHMLNFTMPAQMPSSLVPNSQKEMDSLRQQVTLAPQQAAPVHQQHGMMMQQRAALAHHRPTLAPQPPILGQQHYLPAQYQGVQRHVTPASQLDTPGRQDSTPGSQRDTPVLQQAPQRSTPAAQVSPATTPHRTPSSLKRTPSESPLRTSQRAPTPHDPSEPDHSKEIPLVIKREYIPQPIAAPQKRPASPSIPKTASQESTPVRQDSSKDETSEADTTDVGLMRQRCLSNREDFYSLLSAISKNKKDPRSPVLVNDQPIDLHDLWSSCIGFGGPVECGKSKSWAKVREKLAIDCPQSKVPSRLKSIWRKHLLALESFLYPDHASAIDPKKKKADSGVIKQEPVELASLLDSPAVSTDSPHGSAIKRRRYDHPPRTQPYDYIPLALRQDTYGRVNLTQLYNEQGTPDIPGGEVPVHALTMSLRSQQPMAVAGSLTTLLAISLSTPVMLERCAHLTEVLLELVKADFAVAFPNPLPSSDSTYESLYKQYYEETLDLRTTPQQPLGPSKRIVLVFAILRNFSFLPDNQPYLAKQADLVGWFFLVVHSPFPKECVGEALEIRKHLLVFLSNVIGHWIIDKDALKPTARLPTHLPPLKILNFVCEFLEISGSPIYPSLALECLAKLTTLDRHRLLLAPLTSRCCSILVILSGILQEHFSNESEPIDEPKLVYLLHLLMAIVNVIDVLGDNCEFPLSLPKTLIRTAKWLATLEAFERGLKEPRSSKSNIPNPSSYMNKIPLPKQDRQDVLVKLAMRALNALNALFCLPPSQDSNLLVSHRGTLVELLALPSIDVTLTTYINLMLNPVLCPPN